MSLRTPVFETGSSAIPTPRQYLVDPVRNYAIIAIGISNGVDATYFIF